jgi:hypothetical protein
LCCFISIWKRKGGRKSQNVMVVCKRGCMVNQLLSPFDLLGDLWRVCGFQANFLYSSMH